ncbi:hypothetical protein FUAX_06840 [Fulvitalea axinellae]|uniref:DUF3278 domain-containing protein n=1 Tax=Fulvitalea axinellae TaxID=1182444 RepID=A0AAU9CMY8_9BACT|nr:hypothetical protein FUAX_06840 [Fulvitalea axinellae]
MSDELDGLDDLKNIWDEGKTPKKLSDAESVIQQAKELRKKSRAFHYSTIIILSTTLVALILFFRYVAPVQELLSRAGALIMMAGLALRIVFEIWSLTKLGKIRLTDQATDSTKAATDFCRFRKTVHGPVASGIVIAYTVGFFALNPEFSKYFTLWQMVAMDLSYVIMAVVLFINITKGMRLEMERLHELERLQEGI